MFSQIANVISNHFLTFLRDSILRFYTKGDHESQYLFKLRLSQCVFMIIGQKTLNMVRLLQLQGILPGDREGINPLPPPPPKITGKMPHPHGQSPSSQEVNVFSNTHIISSTFLSFFARNLVPLYTKDDKKSQYFLKFRL